MKEVKNRQHSMRVAVGTELFINKYRSVILFPYAIDLAEREFKAQIWFDTGGVASEWLSISDLDNYNKVDTEGINIDFDNLDEDDIFKVFELYEKKLIDRNVLNEFKETLDKLENGDLLYVSFPSHSNNINGEYRFIIEEDKFKLTPIKESSDSKDIFKFDFKNYNRREFEEHMIARICVNEVKSIHIVE